MEDGGEPPPPGSDGKDDGKDVSLKVAGETMLEGIVNAAFDFADNAPIEHGRKLHSFLQKDVKKALDAMETVHEYGGAMCDWLANRNGHRRTLKGNWGGPRVKAAAAVLISEMEERLANVDPKVKEVVEDELEKVKERCEKATSNLPEGDLEEEESTSAA